MPHLETVVNATAGQDDTYLSQSSFWTHNRRVVSFKQTRAAWVDLDVYNIGRTVDAALIAEVLRHGEMLGIPVPTVVISSGRGCYLKWIFEVPVSQAQLPVWQLLQATLTAAYSSLAADFKARDACRVFRLIQTRNSKSGELVSAIDGSGKYHDFGALCQAVQSLRGELLVEQAQAGVISTVRKTRVLSTALIESARCGDVDALALYSEVHRPIMLKSMSAQSLNWLRFCDLRDLFSARGGIKVGERDNALFWMLNFLSHAEVIRAADWEVEIDQLLQAFPDRTSFQPLADGSMNSLLRRLKDKEAGQKYSWRSIEVSPLYRPSNDFMIEAFGIKPEEMSGLKTLISSEEKRNRVDLKNEGRADKRVERIRWREEVREAFLENEKDKLAAGEGAQAQPMNLTALARYVGVERTRLSRFWNQLGATRTEKADLPTMAVSTQKPPGRAVKAVKAPKTVGNTVPVVQPQPIGSTNNQTNVCQEDVDRALLALEASRQARLALELAQQAQQAAKALAFERQIDTARERWVTRKITDLMVLDGPVSEQQPAQMEVHMSTIPQSPSTHASNLFKRLNLLNVAKGEAPLAPPATEPIHPHLLDSDPFDNWHEGRDKALPGNAVRSFDGFEEYAGETAAAPVAYPARNTSTTFTPQDASSPSRPAASGQIEKSRSLNDRLQSAAKLSTLAQEENNTQSVPEARTSNPAPRPTPAPAPPQGAIPQAIPQEAVKKLSPAERIAAARRGVSVSSPGSAPTGLPSPRLAGAGRTNDPPKGVDKAPRALVEGGVLAPGGYPAEQEWPSNTIAPGSRYSQEQWNAARVDAEGNCYEVLEMQSPYNSWLVQFIKPKVVNRQAIEGGRINITTELMYPPDTKIPELCNLVAQLFSDCIWVSTKALPTYAGAVEGQCDLGGASYRVIRPRLDYLEPERAFRVNTKIKIPTGFGANPTHESEDASIQAPSFY